MHDILTPMITRTLTVGLVAMAVTAGAFGQHVAPPKNENESLLKTAGSFNGRFWRTCSETEKDIFLFGYSDGLDMIAIATSSDYSKYKIVRKKYWADSLTASEVRAALDRFYDTPENGPIAISNAIVAIARRSEGLDEESVQKLIYNLRALSELRKDIAALLTTIQNRLYVDEA